MVILKLIYFDVTILIFVVDISDCLTFIMIIGLL